ncbi:plasma membrane transporter [Ecytonucleospora hepatopenaei]|uniref:Plasma membrane transporter n=1 Tax=Ecytonucleospora hepatopenaei TaxID=646526 RepID=A0A1W0E4M0_9MICR|nr:plasma membrane transporter [Ecytonucleospora hepatopenaei]
MSNNDTIINIDDNINTIDNVNNSRCDIPNENINKDAELIFKNLKLKTKDGKILLNGISGKIKPGKMVALMGSSGAGKTTLLNSLTGRLDSSLTLTGEILVNNRRRVPETWPKISAYVSQTFHAYENLTVKETLGFIIKILIKKGVEIKNNTNSIENYNGNSNNTNINLIKNRINNSLVDNKINDLLKILGLEHAKENKVKELSGGERIRLSVGIELVGNPSILFLDEPISGLDSFNAVKILKFLRDLAHEQRKTLIVTIHQPSYKMVQFFDKIFLMAKGGVVFDGTCEDCVDFFKSINLNLPENTNPTDFFLDEIAVYDEESERKVENMKKSFSEYVKNKNITYEPTIDNNLVNEFDKDTRCCKFNTVLYNVFTRNLKDYLKDKPLLFVQTIQRISIGFLLSVVYWQLGAKNPVEIFSFRGVFTFFVMELFGICGPIFNLFKQEQQVILRERQSGLYSGYTSYIAKFLSEMTFLILFEFIYLTVVYLATGFYLTFWMYLQFLFMMFSIVMLGVTMGLTISCATSTPNSAQALGSTISILFILFSGAFNNPNEFPSWLRWIIYISPIQYAFRGLLQSQAKGREFSDGIGNIDGDELLKAFGLESLNYGICIVMVLVIGFLIGLLGSFILHKQTKTTIGIVKK